MTCTRVHRPPETSNDGRELVIDLFGFLNAIRFLLILLCVCAVQAGGIGAAIACDLCSVYSATRASGADARGFGAGAAEQFTHQGTLQQDGRAAANPLGQFMDSSITQLFSSYTFNNRFGVQLTIPVITRFFKRAGMTGVETGSVSGIGDITLTGTFMPYQRFTENFSFSSQIFLDVATRSRAS